MEELGLKQPFDYFWKTNTVLVKKFFPLDKNYLLKEAQRLARVPLLSNLVDRVKTCYELQINPLGLEDSFTSKIRHYQFCHTPDQSSGTTTLLDGFYENLAAIYRYKFGDNQLGFLWDGSDHIHYYQKTWKEAFIQWTDHFCQHGLFIQAVLDLTVFLPENPTAQLVENRMNHFILKYFEVKIHQKKGIIAA